MKLLIFLTATLFVSFSCGTPLNNDVSVSDYLNLRPRYRRAFFDDNQDQSGDNQDQSGDNQGQFGNNQGQFDDRRNKTLLCDELKLKAVVDEHASCYRKAEVQMVNKFAANNVKDMENGLCQVITEKADCINFHAPKCLAPERVDMMRMNFLQTEIAKSNRNYDSLGQDFINSCPILYNYQAEFVQTTFGSSKCSYEQVYNLTDSREECKMEALAKKRSREMIALDFLTNLDKDAKRSILFQLYCDFQWDWLACYESTTFSCTSDEKKEEILDAEKKDFRYIEENFREMGIHFTFQECSNYTSNANALA